MGDCVRQKQNKVKIYHFIHGNYEVGLAILLLYYLFKWYENVFNQRLLTDAENPTFHKKLNLVKIGNLLIFNQKIIQPSSWSIPLEAIADAGLTTSKFNFSRDFCNSSLCLIES